MPGLSPAQPQVRVFAGLGGSVCICSKLNSAKPRKWGLGRPRAGGGESGHPGGWLPVRAMGSQSETSVLPLRSPALCTWQATAPGCRLLIEEKQREELGASQ